MTHEELKAKVQALADAASSNETVKAFANEWLGAEGTDKQAGLTKELPTVVKENIALIDETIDFMVLLRQRNCSVKKRLMPC